MKVLLLDNVRGIGRVGDIKEVNDGYARNFLLPRKLGKPASDSAVREAQTLRERTLASNALELTQARELASKIAGTTVVIDAKANKKGTLFSAVPASDIASRISDIAGVRILPSAVISHEHLKHAGPHTVTLNLAEGVTADITVDIRPR